MATPSRSGKTRGPRLLLADRRAAPGRPDHETDLSALAKGHVTLTPLDYDMTRKSVLAEMETWKFQLAARDA